MDGNVKGQCQLAVATEGKFAALDDAQCPSLEDLTGQKGLLLSEEDNSTKKAEETIAKVLKRPQEPNQASNKVLCPM